MHPGSVGGTNVALRLGIFGRRNRTARRRRHKKQRSGFCPASQFAVDGQYQIWSSDGEARTAETKANPR
jgi:outer membrane receptor for monomeric catechols